MEKGIVNQLLFAKTLYSDLLKLKLFAATYFCDQLNLINTQVVTIPKPHLHVLFFWTEVFTITSLSQTTQTFLAHE